MGQIGFANAACSAACSLTFSKKQKVSPAKDNTLLKKSPSQELLDASHRYVVTDSLLLNGLGAMSYRKKTLSRVATTMGYDKKVQWFRLGSENVLQQPSGGVSHLRLD